MKLAFDYLIHYIRDPEVISLTLQAVRLSNHKGAVMRQR